MTLDSVIDDFEAFYRDLHPRLVSALATIAGDRDLAIDAADEAAAQAMSRWSTVAAMDNPQGWVFRVGVNHLKRRARRRAIETTLLRRHRDPPAVLPGPTGEIWSLVADLSPRQRQAVALRHLGQLTEPEIADALGVSRGTVSSTLSSRLPASPHHHRRRPPRIPKRSPTMLDLDELARDAIATPIAPPTQTRTLVERNRLRRRRQTRLRIAATAAILLPVAAAGTYLATDTATQTVDAASGPVIVSGSSATIRHTATPCGPNSPSHWTTSPTPQR
ncbi:MAG: sigma factor-like helix-turn-helix DNA-binding protein [Acidimicrobiales bacterium]